MEQCAPFHYSIYLCNFSSKFIQGHVQQESLWISDTYLYTYLFI